MAEFVVAMFDYQGNPQSNAIPIKKGDIMEVLVRHEAWIAVKKGNVSGYVPKSYVQLYSATNIAPQQTEKDKVNDSGVLKNGDTQEASTQNQSPPVKESDPSLPKKKPFKKALPKLPSEGPPSMKIPSSDGSSSQNNSHQEASNGEVEIMKRLMELESDILKEREEYDKLGYRVSSLESNFNQK